MGFDAGWGHISHLEDLRMIGEGIWLSRYERRLLVARGRKKAILRVLVSVLLVVGFGWGIYVLGIIPQEMMLILGTIFYLLAGVTSDFIEYGLDFYSRVLLFINTFIVGIFVVLLGKLGYSRIKNKRKDKVIAQEYSEEVVEIPENFAEEYTSSVGKSSIGDRGIILSDGSIIPSVFDIAASRLAEAESVRGSVEEDVDGSMTMVDVSVEEDVSGVEEDVDGSVSEKLEGQKQIKPKLRIWGSVVGFIRGKKVKAIVKENKPSSKGFMSKINISPQKSVLAVEVGYTTIKIVEVKRGVRPKLLRYDIIRTPHGAVGLSGVKDVEAVKELIKTSLKNNRIKTKDVVSVVTNQNLMIQNVVLPNMPKKEFKEALTWQLEKLVHLNKEDAVVDFDVSNENKDNMVTLVATSKEPVITLLDLLVDVGLNPISIDIAPLALFKSASFIDKEIKTSGAHLFCDFGGISTVVSIFSKGKLKTHRVISVGGADATKELERYNDLTQEEAELEKKSQGCSPLLLAVYDNIFSEITNTVNYYLSDNKRDSITSVWVSGGEILVCGFMDRLTEVVQSSLGDGVKVIINDPADKLGVINKESVVLTMVLGTVLGDIKER